METTAKLERLQIPVAPEITVSGVLTVPEWWPTGTRVAVALGHDTDGSLETELLVSLTLALAERGYLALRFNFPYIEQGKKRPDPPQLLERSFRAAAASLLRDAQNAPSQLVVGGLGLGARVAAEAIAGGLKADGLVAMSYPLHPSGKPTQLRAEALFRIICPILFIQGTRDPTCRLDRLQNLLRRIGAPTRLHVVEDGDHKLGVIKRSGRTPEEVEDEVHSAVDRFAEQVTSGL